MNIKYRVMKMLLLMLSGMIIPLSAASIVPGQAIQLKILGVPTKDQGNINSTYTVNDRGYIRVWYLNDVKASGLTSDQLARKIEAAYKSAQIFTHPTVQIVAGEDQIIQQKMITVGGDVRSPGAKPHMRNMTLYQAVTAAGGPTEFGRVTEIQLHRNGKIHTYNLKDDRHKQLRIYAGDTVIVPRKGWLR